VSPSYGIALCKFDVYLLTYAALRKEVYLCLLNQSYPSVGLLTGSSVLNDTLAQRIDSHLRCWKRQTAASSPKRVVSNS